MSNSSEKHVLEINSDYIKGMKFHYIDHVSELLDLALEKEKVKSAIDFAAKEIEKPKS